MYYQIPKGTQAVQGIPLGRLNDLQNQINNISTSGGGHIIQEDGTSLTQRAKLNFIGTGVNVSDDSGNDATIVSISSSGGGLTISTPAEPVNSSNTVYTVTAEPLYVISDGLTYFPGSGYTYSALSITLDSPPTQYIKYVFGSGITVETPSGLVNSSNTTYAVTATPKYIVADGITYFENNGYTIVGLTVTMTSEPTQYIRSIY